MILCVGGVLNKTVRGSLYTDGEDRSPGLFDVILLAIITVKFRMTESDLESNRDKRERNFAWFHKFPMAFMPCKTNNFWPVQSACDDLLSFANGIRSAAAG